jgi:hypothetical protein
MQKEGVFNIGNPYNPLAIEYHGAVTQEKKRWNQSGVSMFSSRTKGYQALQDYMTGYGTGAWPILVALTHRSTPQQLFQALVQASWPGQGPAAALSYAQSVWSDIPGDKTYMNVDQSGNFIGSGPTGPTSSSTAPKHNTAVYIDQYGNRALRAPTNAEVYSAYERVKNTLRAWDLGDPALVNMVYARAVAGEDYNQIIADIRKTPQYDAAFPGMNERTKLGLPLMTETQYVSVEHAMMSLATKYALPRGFISKHEIGQLVAHDVSPVEFNQRLRDLSVVAQQADPLVKREFEKYYGVKNSLGALTAYFANPNRATVILNQQLQSAEFGAQTVTSGLGPISKGQAMQLAHYEYQHTPGSVASAINDAANLGYLRAGAPGSVAPKVSTTQLLGAEVAGYGGTSLARAREAVRTAESARESFLSAGGGYEATAKGVRGAGSASTEGVGQ